MASFTMAVSRVPSSVALRPFLQGTGSLREASLPAFRPVQSRASLSIRAQATEGADVASAESAVAALKLQSDGDRLKEKKEARRKWKLKQKRALRKKGRWPPSKMKALQNV